MLSSTGWGGAAELPPGLLLPLPELDPLPQAASAAAVAKAIAPVNVRWSGCRTFKSLAADGKRGTGSAPSRGVLSVSLATSRVKVPFSLRYGVAESAPR